MNKVYCVKEGTRVHGLYSSRKKALKACELLKEEKVSNLNRIYGNAIGEIKITETKVENTQFYNIKISHHEGLPIITYCFEIEIMEVK